MKLHSVSRKVLFAVSILSSLLLARLELTLPAGPFPKFVEQTVDPNFGIGYAVNLADVNRDGKTDIVAINPTQAVWFENPTWKKQVLMDGLAKKDNVCIAVHDIDGDGRLDLALGAEWMPANTVSGGSLQWLRQPGRAGERWELFPIGSEPTLHRVRWADCDGAGKKKLIVAPLHGRETRPPNWGEGRGVRLLRYAVPKDPTKEPWQAEVIDESLHVLHNFLAVNFDTDPADEIITASLEGIYLFDLAPDGKWNKRRLGEGNEEEEGTPGAGEIKMGKFSSGRRYLATIEPWHGHQLAVYVEPPETGALWKRRLLDGKLKQGHALGCANFDGDGDEELVVGWREAGDSSVRPGIAIYDPQDEQWSAGRKYLVDDGGMAAEDLAVADLNHDGFVDVVASGRATRNLKIYWHPGKTD
jgi:FG-GAP-like repeat